MGLFRSYERDSGADQSAPTEAGLASTAVNVVGGKKNAPTPTRKQSEQARMERLHPVLTKKEIRQRNRETSAAAREKQYAATESRPERVLLRNYVDSRRSPAEFTWPLLLVLLVLAFIGPYVAQLSLISVILIWAVFVVDAGAIWWSWRGYKRELTTRHPGAPTRGLLTYMMSRMIMPRRFRQPACAIARGQEY